jgi:hypothetical protein
VFAHACKMGLEGIVSKRKDSLYRSGRSPDWLVEEPSLRGGEAGARNGSDLREAKMSEVGNLETLRGHFVSVRRQEVAKVLRSKSRSLVAARRLKATQDIIDALDRAIVDENRLHPPPVEQPE